jgi:hypothetical protein
MVSPPLFTEDMVDQRVLDTVARFLGHDPEEDANFDLEVIREDLRSPDQREFEKQWAKKRGKEIVGQEPTKRFCIQCGKELKVGARFCGACGAATS